MGRPQRHALVLGTSLLLLLAACDATRARPVQPDAVTSVTAALAACTRCHGDARNGNAAPPVSVLGATSTSVLGVGAHQQHLRDGAVRQAIACGECHIVPAAMDTPGHPGNLAAPVTFGPLATTGGAAPIWDRGQATCASTYCHGATLSAGGALQTPTWTKVDGTQSACGTCHGIPPPAPHPAVPSGLTGCAACHPATVRPDGTIDVAGGKHIDGTVEVGGTACTSCHGDATRAPASIAPAPPADTHGNTATTALGVGAHQTHLAGGAIRAALACSDCHVVPTSTPHANGTVDMTFGALAKTGGLAPSFSASTATCSSTYCHGASLPGGSNTTPQWTKVDGTQAACGTCHGIPPAASTGHPSVGSATTVCAGCHPATVKPDGTIDTAGGKHVNGVVDVAASSCTSCHGDATRVAVAGADVNVEAAPPVDTHGNTATTARGVGAHQAHVNNGSGALSTPTACAECHVVPTSIPHANGTVNVTFGTKATTGGVTPTWNGTSCATTYCHGATLAGGTNKSPSWTGGSSQAACGTCHGVPPSSGKHGDHSGRVCSDCHGGTYTSSSADPSLHVNGTVNVGNKVTSWNPTTGACVGCHGAASW
jgi:predicted CxxxxCH...CXXCH cytochrome family protein